MRWLIDHENDLKSATTRIEELARGNHQEATETWDYRSTQESMGLPYMCLLYWGYGTGRDYLLFSGRNPDNFNPNYIFYKK